MKLVICDLGNVVYDNVDPTLAIARRLRMSHGAFLKAAGDELQDLATGVLEAEAFWRVFAERTGIEVTENLWATLLVPVPNRPVIALLQELRARFRVVAGSNTCAGHVDVMEGLGLRRIFDAVYGSYALRVAKPDAAFFLRILEAEGCAPFEAVFIDDLEQNVAAARRLGLSAVRFTDAASLARALREI